MDVLSVAPVRPAPEQLRRLARYASVGRLAPSKHNTQPWRFTVEDGTLQVWPDLRRRLSVTDPSARELVLSCGAAVAAIQVAAEADGVLLRVTPWPSGPDGPAAVLTEHNRVPATTAARNRLVALLRRRTDRGPLDGAALPPDTPFRLQDAASRYGATLRLVRTPGDRAALSRLVDAAEHRLQRDPAVCAELAAWTALPGSPRPDGVPATASRGPVASAAAAFAQRDFSLPGIVAGHDRDGRDAPLLAVLCTAADRPADWLQGGRALLDVLVTATLAGGAASFLDQPLEVPRGRSVLADVLGLPGHPQVVLRLGAGGPVPATPRRSLPDVVTLP